MPIYVKCTCGRDLECNITGTIDKDGDIVAEVEAEPCIDCTSDSFERGKEYAGE